MREQPQKPGCVASLKGHFSRRLHPQVESLKDQLNVYKPVLLALTTALVCIG